METVAAVLMVTTVILVTDPTMVVVRGTRVTIIMHQREMEVLKKDPMERMEMVVMWKEEILKMKK